jgi:hypothetical protein
VAYFRVELKAWIPYERVVDPEQPLRQTWLNLWLDEQDPLREVDPFGTFRDGPTMVLDYSSRYHGDNHVPYAPQSAPFTSASANHRVCRWCEFDWDDAVISNFTPAQGNADSPSDQDTVYGTSELFETKDYELRGVEHVESPVTSKTAVNHTEATGEGQQFCLRIYSSNPLTLSPAYFVPSISATLLGHFIPGPSGPLIIGVECNHFPSFGMRVQRDGVDIYSDFNTPLNDATQNVWSELGVRGAINLFAGLTIPCVPQLFLLDLP